MAKKRAEPSKGYGTAIDFSDPRSPIETERDAGAACRSTPRRVPA
jgi:hypothetical protein